MFITILFILSCDKKNEVLVYQLDDIIFGINKKEMFQYHKKLAVSEVFSEKSKNIYCGSSLNFYCMDSNRKSYKVCLEIAPNSNSRFKIKSVDTCVADYFKLKGNELTFISNIEMQIPWDSLVILYADFPNKRTKILYQDGDISDFNSRHPFTLSQEVYFIVNKDFGLISSESTNENTMILNVFNDGKIIKSTRGNIFPRILQNINSKLQ